MEINYDEEEYRCCNNETGLRIHQRKVWKKLCETQQYKPDGHKTDDRISPEPSRSGTHTLPMHNTIDSISERKPKIKWSKSTEESKYKKFDNDIK